MLFSPPSTGPFLSSWCSCTRASISTPPEDRSGARAEEFAKNGGVKAGRLRSASQGAFFILAPGGSADDSDYGGTYDKTTVKKIARVVVTIEYAIEP